MCIALLCPSLTCGVHRDAEERALRWVERKGQGTTPTGRTAHCFVAPDTALAYIPRRRAANKPGGGVFYSTCESGFLSFSLNRVIYDVRTNDATDTSSVGPRILYL